MRIIAGRFKGRRLHTVRGTLVRPSADRLKESLFSMIAGRLQDATFLDLFAGTGAIGIEALSRGALGTVFVEAHPAALRCLRRNLEDLGVREGYHVLATRAEQAIGELSYRGWVFDLVYVDPPYESALYVPTLEKLGTSGSLHPDGWVIVEHAHRYVLPQVCGVLRQFRTRRCGDSCLSFFSLQGSDTQP